MSALPGRPLPRILLSTLASASGVVLLLSLKPHTSGGAVTVAAPARTSTPTATATAPGNGSTGAAPSGTRTVVGDAVQTRYGPVQLSITLTGGKITAVRTLQLPTDSPRDQEISDFAVPQLTQEALAAQNASIDTVSGATYTSEGYAQSLQSALDKAGNG